MSKTNLPVSLRLFKALGDETRLRMLHLLRENELSVSELVRILNVHQSNISRHLNHLKESGLVQDRREGTLSWFRWSKELKKEAGIALILKQAFEEIPEAKDDLNLLAKIIDERKLEGRKFFDQIAGRYKDLAKPGGGLEALLEAFLSLHPLGDVADLGCGEGELSLILARHSRTVCAVDLSTQMLDVVRNKASKANIDNLSTQIGDIENLPLDDSSIDLALLSQALHHSSRPTQAIQEISRILRPGGQLLLLDLHSHDLEWMREQLGDLWLGFESEEIQQWIADAGLILKYTQTIEPEMGIPVLILTAIKPTTQSTT